MKKFYLITNQSKDENLEFSKSLVEYIVNKGGSAGVSCHRQFELSDIPTDTECILVLGGDGTLIRVATHVQSLNVPLLGVNLGTLGYLCELEKNTVFEAVDLLLEDKYHLEERMLLCSEDEFGLYALNDVVVKGSDNFNFLHLDVYVNGKRLNTYHADGIIISTPTGSTGYNLSAGGPIVDPAAKMIVLTPINDHNMSNKSIVLSESAVIEVELTHRRIEKDEQAFVSFDGDVVHTMNVGERITVKAAPTYVKICKLKKRSFLEQLRRKMEQYN